MKKQLLTAAVLSTILVSCGGDDKKESSEEGEKMCKTLDEVKVPCKDLEVAEKLEDMAFKLVKFSPSEGIGYQDAITQNEAIFKEIDPLMPSIESIMKLDTNYKNEYFVETIYETKALMEDYKNILVDLETIEISGSWEQDPLFEDEMDEAIYFKNTTERTITYMAGRMTYFDSTGTILAEDDVDFYSFHFDSEIKDGLPAGYEGVSDRGINCDKEKRAMIDSIDVQIDEIRYNLPGE